MVYKCMNPSSNAIGSDFTSVFIVDKCNNTLKMKPGVKRSSTDVMEGCLIKRLRLIDVKQKSIDLTRSKWNRLVSEAQILQTQKDYVEQLTLMKENNDELCMFSQLLESTADIDIDSLVPPRSLSVIKDVDDTTCLSPKTTYHSSVSFEIEPNCSDLPSESGSITKVSNNIKKQDINERRRTRYSRRVSAHETSSDSIPSINGSCSNADLIDPPIAKIASSEAVINDGSTSVSKSSLPPESVVLTSGVPSGNIGDSLSNSTISPPRRTRRSSVLRVSTGDVDSATREVEQLNSTDTSLVDNSSPKAQDVSDIDIASSAVNCSSILESSQDSMTSLGTPLSARTSPNSEMNTVVSPSSLRARNSNVKKQKVGSPAACSSETQDKSPRSAGATSNESGPADLKIPFMKSVGPRKVGRPLNKQRIVEQARQEVEVMRRVRKLRDQGLWSDRPLSKCSEPKRQKTHWDYLLEEVVWLSNDFVTETKWKKAAAKKCARMMQKYHQDRCMQQERSSKEFERDMKRMAANVAREIRSFWSNIEKIVEFKINTRLEEQRKQALDEHLNYIVDQTEKYSERLTEALRPEQVTGSCSAKSEVSKTRVGVVPSDDEFEPDSASEDDEQTIARAERDERTQETDAEVKALHQESEMTMEDVLDSLPEGYLEAMEASPMSSSSASSDDEGEESTDDADFDISSLSAAAADDDETTINEQEEHEDDEQQRHGDELSLLQKEGELPLAELRKMYGVESQQQQSGSQPAECSPDSATESVSDTGDPAVDSSTKHSEKIDENHDIGLRALLDTEGDDTETRDGETLENNEISNAAAMAEAFQPKGYTLSSTTVKTPVPFLLRHSLREYQHVGLEWLATMHDKQLNGILADEMGLGKTIQTIALLAHLACEHANWGPHLVVVPTSVMLNWEMEFKKWCPSFKILVYYGGIKERRVKRTGWTRDNAFHVCITSYKLVVQDHAAFRRKEWQYLILDEAHNIKNFKSQRWQMLLNFNSQSRLLLTGTPLQNNLMELWSLMHFLMPHVFASHREFKEWFANPMSGMVEGNAEYNEKLIRRLHKVLRPFLLRRLKSEVEKQMPKKFEHVITCRLSKRQRYLYEEYMSRSNTRATLAGGGFLSVIDILMQLRKVCNHPDMFEPRQIVSPLQLPRIEYRTASLAWSALQYDPQRHVQLSTLNLLLIDLELLLTAFAAHRIRRQQTPRHLIAEIDRKPPPPPRCPAGRIRLHVRTTGVPVQPAPPPPRPPVTPAAAAGGYTLQLMHGGVVRTVNLSALGAAAAPLAAALQRAGVRPNVVQLRPTGGLLPAGLRGPAVRMALAPGQTTAPARAVTVLRASSALSVNRPGVPVVPAKSPVVLSQPPASSADTSPRYPLFRFSSPSTIPSPKSPVAPSPSPRAVADSATPPTVSSTPPTVSSIPPPVSSISTVSSVPPMVPSTPPTISSIPPTVSSIPATVSSIPPTVFSTSDKPATEPVPSSDPALGQEGRIAPPAWLVERRQKQRITTLNTLAIVNRRRCEACPIYGLDLIRAGRVHPAGPVRWNRIVERNSRPGQDPGQQQHLEWPSLGSILTRVQPLFEHFLLFVPAVVARPARLHVSRPTPWRVSELRALCRGAARCLSRAAAPLHRVLSARAALFPERRLIQYDCGKLQVLDRLLHQLRAGGHRVLIFTQMTRMLDILEQFLNYHGLIYLRLDGTTRVEQRQALMERFNADRRVFCFILSTRSGGIGVNLTGADTVIFYDSDWNPTMDAQAQDRCHRIGQTRDVHIYRLVSERTIEQNILRKANEKRLLGELAIEGGNFTAAFFKQATLRELFDTEQTRCDPAEEEESSAGGSGEAAEEAEADKKAARSAYERALASAEDENDAQAARAACAEQREEMDGEFEESRGSQQVRSLLHQLSHVERWAVGFLELNDEVLRRETKRVTDQLQAQRLEWASSQQRSSPSPEIPPQPEPTTQTPSTDRPKTQECRVSLRRLENIHEGDCVKLNSVDAGTW